MLPTAATTERPLSAAAASQARVVALRLVVGLAVAIGVLLAWSAASSAEAQPTLTGDLPGPVSGVVSGAGGAVQPVVNALPPAPVPPVVPTKPALPPAPLPAPPVVSTPSLPPTPSLPDLGSAPAPAPIPMPEVVTPPTLPGTGEAPALPEAPSLPAPAPIPGLEPGGSLPMPVEGILDPRTGSPIDPTDALASGHLLDPPVEATTPNASIGGLVLPAPTAGNVPDGLAATAAASSGPSGTQPAVLTASPAAPASPASGSGGPTGALPTPSSLPLCGGPALDRAPHGAPPSTLHGGDPALRRARALGLVTHGDSAGSSIARLRPPFSPD